jgi:hypothetical protein
MHWRLFVTRLARAFGDTPVTREIPLAEALDDETGVSFGEGAGTIEASSLLEDLPASPPAARQLTWGPREQYLLARVSGVLARGEAELVLSDEDVERLAVPDPLPLPDAFSAMARIAAVSDEAAGRGDFQLLLAGASGPSGARVLGRFCHADSDLAAAVSSHLAAEEALSRGAVFAEIVHLPEGPLGNLVSRPTLRTYEIPYLGRSIAPAERQIPLSDLRVSIRGRRIVLRSAKLEREVVPRLTSAHQLCEQPWNLHVPLRLAAAGRGGRPVLGLGPARLIRVSPTDRARTARAVASSLAF